jgi:phytoene dehydrogenase-like protein
MSETWDAIVIGAGVGGLTAAATLVKAGLRVLILEKNPHPGGTAYAYLRKGFSFPMGPLGFSDPALVKETLKSLGDREDLELEWVRYEIRTFDLKIPLSLPFPEMTELFSRHFPSDAQGVEKFFNRIREIISAHKKSPKRGPSTVLHGSSQISASEYLSKLVLDERLRRVLGSIGTREPYSNLTLLAAMWDLMCNEGIWYPKEGMRSLCDRLARIVTRPSQNGSIENRPKKKEGRGEIQLNKEVVKIHSEDGQVAGVTLRDGTRIDSQSVISNADYKTTFIKLTGPGAVPPEWYHAVSSAKQTGSVFQVCLGVDLKKADFSLFEEADRVIYKRPGAGNDTLNWRDREIDPEVFARQELEVSLWGRNDRTVAPMGGGVIVIRTEAEFSHFTRFRSLKERRVPDYREYKTRLGRALFREIESLIPGVKNAMGVMDIATPLTFEDQGGRSGGAVAGWSWDYEDFHDDQPKELIRTPVKGLYMAGYQAFSALFMGGIPTAMESGKRAARAVIEGSPPIEKILIPLTHSFSP